MASTIKVQKKETNNGFSWLFQIVPLISETVRKAANIEEKVQILRFREAVKAKKKFYQELSSPFREFFESL